MVGEAAHPKKSFLPRSSCTAYNSNPGALAGFQTLKIDKNSIYRLRCSQWQRLVHDLISRRPRFREQTLKHIIESR